MFGALGFSVSNIDEVNANMTTELNAMGQTSDAQKEIARLQLLVQDLREDLAVEEEEVHCCPHCTHGGCDGNCDFNCRKEAKKEGCDGTVCGARSCKVNHRTSMYGASDLRDFKDRGGKQGTSVVVK